MSTRSARTTEDQAALREALRTPVCQVIDYAQTLLDEREEAATDEGAADAGLIADLKRIRCAGRRLLDILDADGESAPPAAAEPAAAPAGEGLATGDLLIVDDDEANRELLRRHLERQGHRCAEATTGAEALHLLAHRPFDAVLLDVRMPDLDGYQVLRRIKSDPATADLPVIMTSAIDEVESIVRCLDLGAAEYLPKPFNPVLLRARLGACLRDKHARDARSRNYSALAESWRREHAIAAAFQKPLLGDVDEDAFPGLSVATAYEAALSEAEVGGDYADAFTLPDGRVALVVADVSGKGLGAATRSTEVKHALRVYAREFGGDPAGVLRRLNAFLCDTASSGAAAAAAASDPPGFVCLAFAVIDPSTGEALIASAGCEPPLLLRAAAAEVGSGPVPAAEPLDAAAAPPLGIAPELSAAYRAQPVRLAPGDTLILCTDGITESRRGREFLGYDGFAALAREASAGAPTAHALAAAILDGARRFRDPAGGAVRDDACLLVARRG